MAAIEKTTPVPRPSQTDSQPHGAPPPRKRASELLREIVEAAPEGEISIGQLVAGLSDRAWGIANLLFALPNCVPLPPGVGSIFGLPMLYLGGQMVLGRPHPWLPSFIAERRMGKDKFLQILDKVEPQLKKLEKICKPRLNFLVGRRAERLLGGLIFLAGVGVALPGPGSNLFPSIGVVILSLGLIEDDGVFILAGIVATIIGTIIATAAVAAFVGLMIAGFLQITG